MPALMQSRTPEIHLLLSSEMATVCATQKCTKRTAVRLAISNLVSNGDLKSGDYLPPELTLASIMNVSLGTVQAALGQLQDVGMLTRRRGDGSRIASNEPHGDNTWHFRFISIEDHQPLHLIEEHVMKEEINQSGVWSPHLGVGTPCFKILRQMTYTGGMKAVAQMYVLCSDVPQLADIEAAELQMLNKRPFLEQLLNRKIVSQLRIVGTVSTNEVSWANLGIGENEQLYDIRIRTFFTDNQPAYYQRILVPQSGCRLSF